MRVPGIYVFSDELVIDIFEDPVGHLVFTDVAFDIFGRSHDQNWLKATTRLVDSCLLHVCCYSDSPTLQRGLSSGVM